MWRRAFGRFEDFSDQKMMYGKMNQERMPFETGPFSNRSANVKPFTLAPPVRIGQGGPTGVLDMMPTKMDNTSKIQFRAEGGPVKKKKKYIVGEEGPEIFVPEEDGQIIPNPRTSTTRQSQVLPDGIDLSAPMREPIEEPGMNPNGNPSNYVPRDPNRKTVDGVEYVRRNTGPRIFAHQGDSLPEEQWDMVPPEPQAPAAPTPYENARANYEKALRTPAEKQSALKQGLFFGLQGLEKFGDALAGVKNDKPVEWLGNAKRNAEIQRTGNILGPMERMRQQDLENQVNQTKAIGQAADARKKMIEAVQQQNPLLGKQIEEALKGNGTVTPEMIQAARDAGYGHVFEADNRARKDVQIGGVTYSTPTSGKADYSVTNAPVDPGKVPIRRELRDGTPFFTTGNEAADREAIESYRQAQIDMEAGKFNIEQFNKYETDLQKWAAGEAERNNKLSSDVDRAVTLFNEGKQAEQEAANFDRQAQELRNNPRYERDTDIQKQYNDLVEKASKARMTSTQKLSESNALHQGAKNSKGAPMPTRPTQTLESPNISSGGTITNSVIDEMMKVSGKSRKEILDWAKQRNKRLID